MLGIPMLIIKNSPISGKGVFTTVDIQKDQFICFLEGEVCSLDQMMEKVKKEEEEPSDLLEVDDETYLDLDELSRTFNHSCNPNAYIRGKNKENS